jgi:hypothetical protein
MSEVRIDEVSANRAPVLNEALTELPTPPKAPAEMFRLQQLRVDELERSVEAKAAEGER